jgi:hypothetical protein
VTDRTEPKNISVKETKISILQAKQEVLERTNLPAFLKLFKNVIVIKTSV